MEGNEPFTSVEKHQHLIWFGRQRGWEADQDFEEVMQVLLHLTLYILHLPLVSTEPQDAPGCMCCGLLSTHQVVKEANCFLFSRVNLSLWELSIFRNDGIWLLFTSKSSSSNRMVQECLREQHFWGDQDHTRTHMLAGSRPKPLSCLQDLALNVAEGSHATVQQNVARYILTVSVFVPKSLH